ncbi:MAG: response regulator transcription factor [Noviherbaspirillum sp.]
MRIAVLDNDRSQADLICQILRGAAHICQPFQNGKELFDHLHTDGCELLVMNWQSADTSGAEILHAARGMLPPAVPLLLVANRSAEDHIVGALGSGASDYLIKPIRRGELLTRVQVLLKRAYPELREVERAQFGPYTFDTHAASVTIGGMPIEVTQKEFELALLFFRNLGRPLSRAFLLEAIWTRDTDLPSRSIDTHVSRVRSKLGLRPENGFRLVPVYSYGYRLEQLPR